MAKSDKPAAKGDKPAKAARKAPAADGRAPVVSDPRFARIHSDPRFIRARRDASKLTIDSRFEGMLKSKDFGSSVRGPSVDKYGRPRTVSRSKELQRFYKLEDEERKSKKAVRGDDDDEAEEDEDQDEIGSGDDDEAASDAESDAEASADGSGADEDDSSQGEEEGGISGFDLARGEGLVDSSDEDEAEDDAEPDADGAEAEDAINVGPYAEESVPTGDETRRFAVVNMDWDHVKARDLYKVFDAFRPKSGILHSVKIYPSEFGKERMALEAAQGPPKSIFRSAEERKSSRAKADKGDEGEEFDPVQLRKYQLERLRYYYAVVECDSVATARAIYQACDGSEFESSANFIDLRYVPDDMTFDDAPTDAASSAPLVYQPVEFVTQALQHSNVKLTWDEEDPERVRVTRRKFTKDDIKEMDFKAYLASSSDEEDELGEGEEAEAVRAKYRALLAADGDGDAFGRKGDDEGEEMEITFAPGLSEKAASLLEKKKEEEARKNETVFEAYLRKRKEKRKARRAGQGADDDDDEEDAEQDSESDDMAGREDDPFFQQDFGPEFAKPSKNGKGKDGKGSKGGKDGDDKDGRSKKQVAEDEARSRAELELLLMDENETQSRHFDMKAVLQEEKQSKRKQRGKKGKKGKEAGDVQDDFEVDVADPRFSAVLENHQFAIDPTNPQFRRTKGMDTILRKRREQHAQADAAADGAGRGRAARGGEVGLGGDVVVAGRPRGDAAGEGAGLTGVFGASGQGGAGDGAAGAGSSGAAELSQLVAAVKRKSAMAVQSGAGKRRRGE
ncbi:pre-rRNA-processing protein esf1 [Polyrhizophydium stewartii]|uniref:Pre-rRNA-processing protein esf1 n=1 Tax=Polyrhizophydium stewartii TaxID=2732419 RepID=A0ABR4NEL1_9FUNG